jgi:hypothetical protein
VCCAVAALSTTLSTAALDKHPQSKERGITLDLGFSAFTVSGICLRSSSNLQFSHFPCPCAHGEWDMLEKQQQLAVLPLPLPLGSYLC